MIFFKAEKTHLFLSLSLKSNAYLKKKFKKSNNCGKNRFESLMSSITLEGGIWGCCPWGLSQALFLWLCPSLWCKFRSFPTPPTSPLRSHFFYSGPTLTFPELSSRSSQSRAEIYVLPGAFYRQDYLNCRSQVGKRGILTGILPFTSRVKWKTHSGRQGWEHPQFLKHKNKWGRGRA